MLAALLLIRTVIRQGFLSSDSICPSNAMHVTVNGSLCGTKQYINQPCVSVTVNGQVINNILLDTGSFGLRVFKSVLKTSLTQVKADDGKDLAECVQFGDGSSQWGPVMLASVQLGGESPVDVPIMVVDSTYPGDPGCATSKNQPSDVGPEDAGFNGILGVGLFAHDCGIGCTAAVSKKILIQAIVPTTAVMGLESVLQQLWPLQVKCNTPERFLHKTTTG